MALTLLPFKLESGKGMMIYNRLRIVRLFSYNQGTVTLTSELATSRAQMVEAIFIGHGVNQTLACRDNF